MANKVIGAVAKLETHPDFWQPVRNSLLSSLHPSSNPPASKPVITYVSRQSAGQRRLRQADHDDLVRGLKTLEDRYEVNVIVFEKLPRHEQIHIAARSNVSMI